MGLIKKEIIEEIKENISLLDLVEEYVKLKKRGKSFIGHCPFHDDKSPSFNVSANKGLYHCFGCHEGGDAIRFYEKYHGLNFKTSIEELAKRLGYREEDIYESKKENEKSKKQRQYKDQLIEVMEEACDFFEKHLDKKTIKYLQDSRKLSIETIREYRMGLTPLGMSDLTFHLLNKGFDKQFLLTSGLTLESNGELKDFFQNRIMIPIRNSSGYTVGFSGRRKSENQKSKYVNSKENPIFQKKKLSFNLDKAKKSILNKDYIILTEGYFDVIQLREFGFYNVVACMGTSIDEYQIRNLSKYSPNQNIYLALDNDEGGKKAILQILDKIKRLILSQDINVFIIQQKESKDIDDYLKQGYDFNKLIEDATPAIDYLMKNIIFQNNRDSSKSLHQLKRMCNQIKDEPLQIEYRRRIAKYFSGGEPNLFKTYMEFLNKESKYISKDKKDKKFNKNQQLSVYSTDNQLLYLILFTGYKLWICRELLNKENDCNQPLIELLPPHVQELIMEINEMDSNKYLLYDLQLILDSNKEYISNKECNLKLLNFINANQVYLEHLAESPEDSIQDILNLLIYKRYSNYLNYLKKKLQENPTDDTLNKYIEIKSKLTEQESKIQTQTSLDCK